MKTHRIFFLKKMDPCPIVDSHKHNPPPDESDGARQVRFPCGLRA
jgi:hypothetical protein